MTGEYEKKSSSFFPKYTVQASSYVVLHQSWSVILASAKTVVVQGECQPTRLHRPTPASSTHGSGTGRVPAYRTAFLGLPPPPPHTVVVQDPEVVVIQLLSQGKSSTLTLDVAL